MTEWSGLADVVLASIEGDHSILLDLDARRYYRLNDTAAFIWHRLEASQTFDEIVESLLSEFDTSRERAESNLREFLRELARRGIVRLSLSRPLNCADS